MVARAIRIFCYPDIFLQGSWQTKKCINILWLFLRSRAIVAIPLSLIRARGLASLSAHGLPLGHTGVSLCSSRRFFSGAPGNSMDEEEILCVASSLTSVISLQANS